MPVSKILNDFRMRDRATGFLVNGGEINIVNAYHIAGGNELIMILRGFWQKRYYGKFY
jgi:hypothetical protein